MGQSILEDWKTGVDWNLNIFQLLAEPIRGPGRSKSIMGGGRSLVTAQIHCQKWLPPPFILPFFCCLSSVEGEELDSWLKGSKQLAVIIPSQMPVSTLPTAQNTSSTRPPPAPSIASTDSYISYKGQRLQESLFAVWDKDFRGWKLHYHRATASLSHQMSEKESKGQKQPATNSHDWLPVCVCVCVPVWVNQATTCKTISKCTAKANPASIGIRIEVIEANNANQ